MKDGWGDRPRASKLAGAMFPHLLDAQTQREMIGANPEVRAALERRIAQGNAVYGVKPAPAAQRKVGRLPMTDESLSRVPGLIRVRGYRA
jgi:hypothetical protein